MILVFMLAGCSGDPYENYLGYWEYQIDGVTKRAMSIKKDGDSILLDRNIFNKRKPDVLTKMDGQLSLHGMVTLGLSKDGESLHYDRKTYNRISEKRVSEITIERGEKKARAKKEAELAKILRNKNKKLCNALHEEKINKLNNLSKHGYSNQEMSAKINSITSEYKVKLKAINKCF